MELSQITILKDSAIVLSRDNDTDIICKRIRITNKGKQIAQNKAQNAIERNAKLAERFLSNARGEIKKDKKAKFFAKCKNKNN